MYKILGLILFITQVSFSQQKCDMKDVETFVQNQMVGFQKSEKENGDKLDNGVKQFAKAKKLTQKQETEYYLSMVEKNRLGESMKLKTDMMMQLMEVLKSATETPSEKNCLAIEKVKEFYAKTLKITENEWKSVFSNLEKDYKAVTGKDLVYNN